MSFKHLYRLIPLLLVLFYCCKNNNKEPQQTANANSLPEVPIVQVENNPAAVFKKWQSLLDSNKFEMAKQLGTEGAKVYCEGLAQIYNATEKLGLEKSQIYTTQIVKINCKETGENAACIYVFRDEELKENFTDSVRLVKVEGRWLVDIIEEVQEDIKQDQKFDEYMKDVQKKIDNKQIVQ